MPPRTRQKKITWPKSTELIGIEFTLSTEQDCELYSQYSIGLHAWFLKQIQAFDPELSASLHDGESEKPFSITGLDGQFVTHSRNLQLGKGKTYRWQVNAFSAQAVAGLAIWLKKPPKEMVLSHVPFVIRQIQIGLPATTYQALAEEITDSTVLNLTFKSPTSFRRKGKHLPLPWPRNVFHSYLRRWNVFSGDEVPQDDFLDWMEEHIIIQRHQIESMKVAAGKRGSVTGFTGAIAFSLDNKAKENPEFYQLFFTLGGLAPYCGTGHKTTFGLGQTLAGWHMKQAHSTELTSAQVLLAERIEELTQVFREQRKRTGGERAQDIPETWATILARREQGDSLLEIADELEMKYETVKTYSKLARRSLRNQSSSVG